MSADNAELDDYNNWRQSQGLPPVAYQTIQTRGHSIQPTQSNEDSYLDYTDWRQAQGLTLLAPRAPKRQRHLQLTDRAWVGLQRLALQHGYTYGAKGANVTGYLEALGHGLIHDNDKTNNESWLTH